MSQRSTRQQTRPDPGQLPSGKPPRCNTIGKSGSVSGVRTDARHPSAYGLAGGAFATRSSASRRLPISRSRKRASQRSSTTPSSRRSASRGSRPDGVRRTTFPRPPAGRADRERDVRLALVLEGEREQHAREQVRKREVGDRLVRGVLHASVNRVDEPVGKDRKGVGKAGVELTHDRSQRAAELVDRVLAQTPLPSLLDDLGERAPQLLRPAPGVGRANQPVRPDRDVPPALHAIEVRGRTREPLELADRHAGIRDEAHAGRPHRQRHEPGIAARGRPFRARAVRHLPLELVVELDRERDERVRQQRR